MPVISAVITAEIQAFNLITVLKTLLYLNTFSESPNPEENYMNWTALNACAKFKQIVLEQLKEETEDVFEDALDYENDMRISHEKEVNKAKNRNSFYLANLRNLVFSL